MDHAGQGKIQRAPLDVRNELCRRIENGELGPVVLPWLNGLAEVQRICREHFAGEEVSAKNLSDFRTGYYQKWLAERKTIARQRALSEQALEIVKSSGRNLSDAAAALAAGRLLEAVDKLADDETPPEELIAAIHDLRKGDLKGRELDLKAQALEQLKKDFALREENSAWNVAKKILKAAQGREIQAVADGPGDDDKKMRDIVRIAYGDDFLARLEASRKEAAA